MVYTVSVLVWFIFSCYLYMLFFFFFSSRRRHTRLQGDWSSDVCSSDLLQRPAFAVRRGLEHRGRHDAVLGPGHRFGFPAAALDRKSTRLNSSHLVISYAVFCLKKKKNNLRHERHGNQKHRDVVCTQ